MHAYTNQKGLSLIELMIAMTLGVILLTGVVQIFLSSKQSYGTVMGMSQVLDNGRLAAHFVTGSVRKAGYWGDTSFDRLYGSDSGLVADQYTGVFAADEYIFGTNNDITDANVVDGTDELWVRFNGNDATPMSNCMGTSISGSEVAVERYYLRNPTGTETVSSLVCETTVLNIDQALGTITVPGTPATVTQPLIGGVENVQILYGQRNASATAVQFLAADNVTDWSLVESARMALLIVSPDQSNSPIRSSGFTLLDESTAAPTDTRSRRVFEQSVAVRNPNL